MALDYTLIGKRLKDERKKKGYTQEKLSEMMNVSVAYLSRIENGKTQLNLPRLNEMCTLLDTTEGYILCGVSDNSDVYLNNEINSLIKDCSAENKDLIYKIVTVITDKDKQKSTK